MKILVCISIVPETTTKIKFTNDKLDTSGVSFVVAPYDDYALSKAIDLKTEKNATVVLLNVGTAANDTVIKKALALGADDAVRIDAEPIDALFTATQIYEFAKNEAFDLILMGRESSDFNGGIVHGMVAEMLGWQCITPCMKLDIASQKATMLREIEGGKEKLEASLPLVIGCQEPIAEWKIAAMKNILMANRKQIRVVAPVAVPNATTSSHFTLPAEKTGCKMIAADNVAELVRLLKDEAKVI
jgi:electron transfer flavoprotein beta subunit